MTTEELKEQQKRLELIHDLTMHPGWSAFKEDLQEAFDMQNHVGNIQDEKHLYLSQGRLQILNSLMQTAETTRHHLTEIEKQLAEGMQGSEVGLVDDLPEEGNEQL